MKKTQKVVLKVGDSLQYVRWITTENDFDERLLHVALKNVVDHVITSRHKLESDDLRLDAIDRAQAGGLNQ